MARCKLCDKGAIVQDWTCQNCWNEKNMKRKDELLVYGTLKREGPLHHLIRGCKLKDIARTTTRFLMLDLGHFPAVLPETPMQGSGPDNRNHIYGEVWHIDEALWELLDAVEGAYDRMPVEVEYPNGEKEKVWTYIFARDALGVPIPGGCWNGSEVRAGTLDSTATLWYDANTRKEESDA